MNSLLIEATTATPRVAFDWEAGQMSVRGESYPENSFAFFQPVLEAVQRFLAETDRPFRLDIALTYLNTSSVKCVMDLLDALDDEHRKGRGVEVNWYCDPENERAVEVAEEFAEDVTLPFTIVALSPE